MKKVAVLLCLALGGVWLLVSGESSRYVLASSSNTPQFVHSCGGVPAGQARCHAILVIWPDKHVPKPTPTPAPSPTPTSTSGGGGGTTSRPVANCGTSNPSSGYRPCDLQSAYNLAAASAGSGAGQTVAIVDAYDDPNAESDLGVYRSQFGLPSCTTSNGCFRKVDQNGGTNYPQADGGWAQEISLDLDMVSAICPNCHILLVEAASSSISNLATAVAEAHALGANAISNSYGGSEFSGESAYDSDYCFSNAATTASSGDSGYGAQYPAAANCVTAVGGTSLSQSNGNWTETAWSCSSSFSCRFFGGTGSGCSSYETQQPWQSSLGNVTSYCSRRAIADVSADADPNTGVDVYDSYAYNGQSGWLVFGGTSVSSPIIASVYALAKNTGSTSSGQYPYNHTSSLYDVTSGTNGSCGNDLCNATTGWDGPTGLGTPNGTGAF